MYEYMRGLQRQFFKEPDFPELRDEISLASFAAGFRLAWGIIAELNTEPPYSFAEEEERRMGQQRRDD